MAHLFRRVVHLLGLLILWLYYQFGPFLTLVWFCLGLVLLLESLRLMGGWTVFGQRTYEQKRVSAFAWSVIGMSMVFIFAPGKQFAIPIIVSYAIVDPCLGELRRYNLARPVVAAIGIGLVIAIWFIASINWPTPWWLWLLMGPLTVVAEWPCLKWIDDNALMQLLPLIVVSVIAYFHPEVIG